VWILWSAVFEHATGNASPQQIMLCGEETFVLFACLLGTAVESSTKSE
jgi:hypothetical protein